MPIRNLLVACLLTACGGKHADPARVAAGGGCPPAVPAAVTKAFPGAKQGPCSGEHEDGMDVYEIKLTKADGSVAEVELKGDGTLLGTEEIVATMPDAVAKGFAAKYPGATATRVEKVTQPGKGIQYEIKLSGKEATFSEAGEFVEEEKADGDHEDKDGD